MIKVGIIGSGFGLYGLLPAFNSTPGCQVNSICGKNTPRLLKYCQSIGLKSIYTDWQKMLNNEKLDAVAIAVVPSAQYEIAKQAILKDLHIFAEKPLAANLKHAKELLHLAQKKKIKNVVDFIFPEIEAWVKVKELLDKKTYGKLKQICLNWDFLSYDIKNKMSSWKTDVSLGGGALSLYFCHSLYYLEHFAGTIGNFKSLLSYSKDSKNGAETGVNLILNFQNGVTGYAHLSCNSPGLTKHQLIFICDKATIVLENRTAITSDFIITIHKDGNVEKLSLPVKNQTKEDERVKVVKKIAGRFINSIIDNEIAKPSLQDGVRVQELIEEIRSQNG